MVSPVFTLTVVVPATDRPPTLDRCTAAIRAADAPPQEIVVVDDPALGATAARNAGARRARGEIVVFVDADVEVRPDAFVRLRRAFADDADLTAVFGSYDDDPADRSTVSAFRNLLHHHVHHASPGPADTFWTGLGAIRRSTLLDVGGFDDHRYPDPSIEDIDLGHRLRAAGHRVILDPTVQGTHLKVWTLRTMLWTDLTRRGIPWVALQVRDRRPASTLNCGWSHRLSALAVVALVVALVAWRPLAAVAAAAALVALNHDFYRLLLRRIGPVGAAAGIGLHGLHHLVAVAALPLGVLAALRPVPLPLTPAAGSFDAPAAQPTTFGGRAADDTGSDDGALLGGAPAGAALHDRARDDRALDERALDDRAVDDHSLTDRAAAHRVIDLDAIEGVAAE